MEKVTKKPGRHFVAITDPGTPLEHLGQERSFLRNFSAPQDVGGRYSALSVFGLVPAALSGFDVRRLLDRAERMVEACAFCVPGSHNPALMLGAVLAELTLAGHDKVTFLPSASLVSLPAWIEQLVAESTGKDEKGIIPVADEPLRLSERYGDDRLFVALVLEGDRNSDLEKNLVALEAAGHPVVRLCSGEKADLGQEFFRWEVAVAAASAVLGIHPFNQPDVQLAKDLAREAMAEHGGDASKRDESDQPVAVTNHDALRKAVRTWLASAGPRDYIAVQAFLAPTPEASWALNEIRRHLGERFPMAATLGFGPRFLHSTGQLHKGGPNNGLFLQLVDDPAEDLPVPEADYSFAALIHAQAVGDFRALQQRRRRVLRLSLGQDVAGGLKRLVEVIDG